MNSKIILAVLLFCTSCATQKISEISHLDYSYKKNTSYYTVFPYGGIELPGQWVKGAYNSANKQQIIRQGDIAVSAALGPCDKYEFNSDKSINNYDFVKAYYEWETEHFNQFGLKTEIFEADSTNNYIIWRTYGKTEEKEINNFFLIGAKKCNVTSIALLRSPENWMNEEKISFLRELYVPN